ncbi:MAG: uracil-DNA glycosylase family protein [Caulobacter sp.]|nr:uracil-DNA glycosylase family protein [Caulobacter sp.]
MLESFLELVPAEIQHRSGSVFYSGRSAFSGPSKVYLLGLNPGGSPEDQAGNTIGSNIAAAIARREDDWSAYVHERWEGKRQGGHGMQPQIQHMLRKLGFEPEHVPASNVVFVRTKDESGLKAEKNALLDQCWPVHTAVIERLGVELVLCLGMTAGRWVDERLCADHPVAEFQETNQRGWTSQIHRNSYGQYVATLTHPSRANWRNPDADPTPMVYDLLSSLGIR